MVLFVFLGLSVLISALLARATDRAEAAEAREAELRTLQELSADLVTSLPGRDTYAHMLHRLTRLFGFEAASLHFDERLFGDAIEPVDGRRRRSRSRSTGTPRRRTGPRTTCRCRWAAAPRAGGAAGRPPAAQPRGEPCASGLLRPVRLVVEDERLLKVATEAEVFQQADEVRRSLLAAVSHDLRTPLAAIKASVTDLLARAPARSPEAEREALLAINDEADRLNALVANLLDMSRIEGGMLRARAQTVDLAERSQPARTGSARSTRRCAFAPPSRPRPTWSAPTPCSWIGS